MGNQTPVISLKARWRQSHSQPLSVSLQHPKPWKQNLIQRRAACKQFPRDRMVLCFIEDTFCWILKSEKGNYIKANLALNTEIHRGQCND